MSARSSSPASSASTLLSTPPSPLLKAVKGTDGNGVTIASAALESLASDASATVFIYDLAEQVGFGGLSKALSKSRADAAPVVELQTRDGAGLSLVGRLSQGTSKDAEKSTIITAYTTPAGVAAMAHSLTLLPPPTPSSRLVVQVPNTSPLSGSLALSPSLASLSTALPILPTDCAVILSASPQETVALAALAYRVTDYHVLHVFDNYSSAREISHPIASPVVSEKLSLAKAFQEAGYEFFDYAGDSEAHTVVVLSNGPLALAAQALAKQTGGFGVVTVRTLRPWNEDALKAVLPSSVQHIHVLDEVATDTAHGSLFNDVFAALVDPSTSGPIVKAQRVVPTLVQEFVTNPAAYTIFLLNLLPDSPKRVVSFQPPSAKNVLFFATPGSALVASPLLVQNTFASHSAISARLLVDHDIFSRTGGVTAQRLVLAPKAAADEKVPIPFLFPLSRGADPAADFVAVLEPTLLKSHALLDSVRPGSPVLIVGPWSAAELISSLSVESLSIVRDRQLRVVILNTEALAKDFVGSGAGNLDAVQNVAVHLAFLRLYLAKAATQSAVLKIAKGVYGPESGKLCLEELNARVWDSLVEVDIPTPSEEEASAKPTALKDFQFTAITSVVESEDAAGGARLGTWIDAAKHLLFSPSFTPESVVPSSLSSYEQHPALRPELPDRTFLVTCTVNRRLTPLEYDRNVFHLEFDTAGTGLKYEIGEALGVHGWNDAGEVLEFCKWYGIDPGRVITLPVPGTDGERLHTRTVVQALQQQIDLFGKPPKAFYTDLAQYATTAVDRYALLFIGSPEGSSTFKKLSEKDTVTFADVLSRWPSARPSIEKLCELIGDIKPRHYSIASAQAVVGDRVDLLVVTVDWVTPSGSPRYGQCTRYLSGLKIGQKVTVSIKPSVMKLPPDNMQPLILAGLGTGAAPFRAFLQHRAWLASQSVPVGPVYYYFGSRHQSQEYLYGEEIEAYILDRTITKAGLAFSRDGPKKVYIQHKMLEDAEALARMLHQENGVFYLCGPTWPVGDIYEALCDALVKFNGMDKESAGTYLEDLKEEERYVLEVY